MATNTPALLFRGAATLTTTTVLYTVPAATTTIITNIVVTNTAASAATFTLGCGTAGSNTSLNTTTAIAANSSVYIDLKQATIATNTITGGASAITVSFHISGMTVA